MLLIPAVILAFCLIQYAKRSGRNVSPVFIWIISILLPLGLGGAINATLSTPTQPAWPYNIIAYLGGIIGVVLWVVLADKKSKDDAGVQPNTPVEPTSAAPSVSGSAGSPLGDRLPTDQPNYKSK